MTGYMIAIPVVALLALCGVFYFQLRSANSELREARRDQAMTQAQNDFLRENEKAHVAALNALKNSIKTATDVAEETQNQVAEQNKKLMRRLEEINREAATKNGPIPPILADGLSELRFKAGAAGGVSPSADAPAPEHP